MTTNRKGGEADSDSIFEFLVADTDVREIVKLLGKVLEEDATKPEKRSALMDGVARLVGASAWWWVQSGQNQLDALPTFVVGQKGGVTEADFAKNVSRPEIIRKLLSPLFQEVEAGRCQLTRVRRELDQDWLLPDSETHEFCKQANFGPMILSFRPNGSGSIAGMVLFREFGAELFSHREAHIVHLVLSELGWLNSDTSKRSPAPSSFDISPRLNSVLNLLVQGRARKDIASELGISLNTVSGYAKKLYQRFNVHSQSELIRHFIDGDGG